MRLVALGHVCGDRGVPVGVAVASVGSYTFAAMEDLHRRGGETSFQLLASELVRDAVVVAVHFNVVIDRGADGLPMGQYIALDRQELQGRAIEFGKQTGTRPLAFPERPLVELLQQLGDRFIQFW